MKNLLHSAIALLLCGALSIPAFESMALTAPAPKEQKSHRNNGGGSRQRSTNRESRPSHSRPAANRNHQSSPGNKDKRPAINTSHNRPSSSGKLPGANHGNGNHRPGNGNGNHNGNFKPGNHNPGQLPGANHGNNHGGFKPGNDNGHHNGGHKPDHGNGNHNGGFKPGHHNPGQLPGANHGYRPGHNNHGPAYHRPPGHRPYHPGLPPRPHMPPIRPFHRPVPPPAWRPVGRYPVLTTILGVTFGTTLSLSLNALVNSGYTITGYGDDMVYLSNVPQLNLIWPDATLYYGNGGLASSQFVYYTPYNDLSRYNTAYTRLVNLYGAPINVTNSGVQLSASWFGQNGQFVSLAFSPQYASDGSLAYYTTLSFGN